MTAVAILQPSYLPWLGYFDQIDRVDVFVLYDDVQYDKHGWRNRNRIKGEKGPVWLTVPVRHSGRTGQLILDVEIDDSQNWRDKHVRSLTQLYARAEYRKLYLDRLVELIAHSPQRLVDLNLSVIRLFNEFLGIATPIVLSSTLGIAGDRNQRLINICSHFGADRYISGNAAESYVELPLFAECGISVEWQDYAHPTYRQLHGAFVPYLSMIDLLLNEGPGSVDILRAGRPGAEAKTAIAGV